MKGTISVLFACLFLVAFSHLSGQEQSAESKDPVVHQISIDDILSNHKGEDIYLLRQDSVLWYSKDRFIMTKIIPDDKARNPVQWYPFYRGIDMMESIQGTDGVWRLNAGVPRYLHYKKGGEKYKPFFQKFDAIGNPVGTEIDPHISIHPDK